MFLSTFIAAESLLVIFVPSSSKVKALDKGMESFPLSVGSNLEKGTLIENEQ